MLRKKAQRRWGGAEQPLGALPARQACVWVLPGNLPRGAGACVWGISSSDSDAEAEIALSGPWMRLGR